MKFNIACITFFCSILLSCATQNINSESSSNISKNADELFIVDCLLPGQIRKLGQLATYLTARRAIKTSAGDCEIRGGEYVAYDRANYSTALKIWLPKAQAGNAESQNYVGEIYGKGLGIAPDYDLAHVWYKKAALQGNSKAQMNLGYLYEKGLGVKQDKAIAMEWYSKSSNLSKLDIPFATTLESDSTKSSAEIKLLKAALNNSQAEAKILKNRVTNLEGRLIESKTKLASLQQDVISVKNKIQDETRAEGNNQEIVLLKQDLNEKTKEINRQQNQVKMLENEYQAKIDGLTENLDATKKRAEQIIAELKKDKTPVAQSQVALLEAQANLAETEKNLLKEDITKKTAQVEVLTKKLTAEKLRYEAEIKTLQQRVKAENTGDKPKIEIIDPPFVLTRSGVPMVTLRTVVSQREIVGKIEASSGLMSLSINDDKSKVNDQGLFKTDIKLIGNETPVEIVAVDNKGSKARLNFILSLGKAIEQAQNVPIKPIDKPQHNWKSLDFGNYHALIIGNNNYKKVPKLETPENDARVVEQILSSQYGFKTTLLLNGSRYQILSELNKMRAKLTEADNLLIYYAGHGELDQVNMRGHWLPIDADADNTANWISTVAITDILNSMSVKHILVVSDSCYSGAMTRSSLARLDSGVTGKQHVDWLKAMLKTRSRTVLTSGGLKPVMDGGGGKHSVFAKAFINALRSNNKLLEGQSLYREVSAGIVSIASGYGIDQVPEYAPIRYAGHESGEFFFVPK